ncbi:MAG: hypothetical protein ACLUPV_04065 [Bilophila wadsworthia]
MVTPNGLDMRVIPDYSAERDVPAGARAKLLGAADACGASLRRIPDLHHFRAV